MNGVAERVVHAGCFPPRSSLGCLVGCARAIMRCLFPIGNLAAQRLAAQRPWSASVLVRTYPNCNGAARAMSGASGRAHESAFGKLLGPFRVDKRPSARITMRLLSLNRGAVHGYRYYDRRACNTVEQRQAARPE